MGIFSSRQKSALFKSRERAELEQLRFLLNEKETSNLKQERGTKS